MEYLCVYKAHVRVLTQLLAHSKPLAHLIIYTTLLSVCIYVYMYVHITSALQNQMSEILITMRCVIQCSLYNLYTFVLVYTSVYT